MTFRFIATTFRLSSIHALDAKSLVKTFSRHPAPPARRARKSSPAAAARGTAASAPSEARLSTCLRRFGGLLKAGTLALPSQPAPRLQKPSAPARKSASSHVSAGRARRAARSSLVVCMSKQSCGFFVEASFVLEIPASSPLRLRGKKNRLPQPFRREVPGGRERFTSRVRRRHRRANLRRQSLVERAQRGGRDAARSRQSAAHLPGGHLRFPVPPVAAGRGTALRLRTKRPQREGGGGEGGGDGQRAGWRRRAMQVTGGHFCISQMTRRTQTRTSSVRSLRLKRAPRRPRGWRPNERRLC